LIPDPSGCVILHSAVVVREERYSSRNSATHTRHYKARVPRYFAGN